jgi:hypothetical protein
MMRVPASFDGADGDFEIAGLTDFKIEEFGDFGILGFWDFGILGFCKWQDLVPAFESYGVSLGFWCQVLPFIFTFFLSFTAF